MWYRKSTFCTYRRSSLNKSLFAQCLIGGILIITVIIGANVIAENKGAEIILIHGGKMRDIHFPHHRHQNALGECNVCHDLFPARAGSIAELKSQGKLKKNRWWKSIVSPVTNKENLPERKPDQPPVPDVTEEQDKSIGRPGYLDPSFDPEARKG